MRKHNDMQRITSFLSFASPIVSGIVDATLKALGWKVTQRGEGLNVVFDVESEGKTVQFHLYNLLLEIATVDRDEQPLRFDENLYDFQFFQKKTNQLVQSKIAILYQLLSEDDVDAAIKKVTDRARHYQRIRILRLDEQKPH